MRSVVSVVLRREDVSMSIRRYWTVFVLASVVLLAEGRARADEPVSLGPGLRPYIHTDRYGRTLVDVCPERTLGGPRCFGQRILYPDSHRPPIVPLSGGGGFCSSTSGGAGYAGPPSGAMTPKDVLAAYNIPSTAHADGAIVALAEFPSTNAMSDVNTYRAEFGIPALPACPTDSMGVPTPGGTACFARVGQDGTVNTVSTTDCPGWASEVALDMDMVSAACPDCSIVVVEGDPIAYNLPQMNQIAATVVGAAAVDNGWGKPESGQSDSYFASPTTLSFAASGSNGYDDEDDGPAAAIYPASAPNVISVGGTTLKAGGGGSYSEVVWNDDASLGGGGASGSGCSTLFPMPSYQAASGFQFGSCKMRASVDIAAAAEFCPPMGCGFGGIAVYDIDDGGWYPTVGTSTSSALAAAIMVRVGLAGKDNHALFYANGGAFNDITSGNNDALGVCSTADKVLCTAGQQWDGPTGLGSPNGRLLLAVAGGALEPEPDAGPSDSGPRPDAGVDGGRVDAGSKPPKHDSGAPADAGTGSEIPSSSGCGCSTATSRSSWMAGWLALGLLAFTRRRHSK